MGTREGSGASVIYRKWAPINEYLFLYRTCITLPSTPSIPKFPNNVNIIGLKVYKT